MLGTIAPLRQSRECSTNRLSLPRVLVAVTIVVNLIYWIAQLIVDIRYTGIFYFVGVDFSRFWSAARAFVSTDPSSGYRLAVIGRYMQPLASFYGTGSSFGIPVHGLRVGPVPYPPIFLYLFALLTVPPPLVGFILWTGISIALAAWVLWQLTSLLPSRVRWVTFALLMLSYPLIIEYYVGQMVVILLVGLYLAYREFQRGREFRAGLWLGVLLLKPQYIVVMLLVLLFKRRWSAIAGTAVTGIAITIASFAVGGFGGIWGYVRTILLHYPEYSGSVAIDPHSMITWRALIFDMLPTIGPVEGLFLTALLSAISVVALIPIWRRSWNPQIPHFHTQMFATMIVTQLVAYHSHVHGAVLLLVPAVLMIAEGQASRVVQWLMAAALVGPPFAAGLSVLLFRDLRLIGVLYIILMLLALIWILLDQPEIPRITRGHLFAKAAPDG